jgi:hypothetical protein
MLAVVDSPEADAPPETRTRSEVAGDAFFHRVMVALSWQVRVGLAAGESPDQITSDLIAAARACAVRVGFRADSPEMAGLDDAITIFVGAILNHSLRGPADA